MRDETAGQSDSRQELAEYADNGTSGSLADSRLGDALELLTIPVAAERATGEFIVNTSFALALGFDARDQCANSVSVQNIVLKALAGEPDQVDVVWLQGKRSWSVEIEFDIRGVRTRWHANVVSFRYASVPLRQLQLISRVESSTEDTRIRDRRLGAESSLRNLVEESDFPMFIRVGPRITLANNAFVRLLGYRSIDEVYAVSHPAELVVAKDRARVIQFVEQRDRGDTVSNGYTLRLEHRLGHEVIVRGYGRKIEWQGVPAVHTIFIDISEEAKARRALRDSESKLHTIIDVAPLGMFIHRAGKPLYANPAMIKMLGFKNMEQFLAIDTIWSTVFPETERLAEFSKRRLEGDEVPSSYETTVKRVDGSSIHVRVLPHIIEWDGESAVIACLTDISDLTEALERLRAEEERLTDFASTAASWFWETDENHRISMIGDEYTELLDLPIESVIGQTRHEMYAGHRKNHPEAWVTFDRALAAREPFRDFEVYHLDRNKLTRRFVIGGVPVFDNEDRFTGYRGSARDVTEERKLQALIAYAARHDELTGLINRTEFTRVVDESIIKVAQSGKPNVLGFLDLDGFKIVNDTAGHSVGDQLLVQCANIFRRVIRSPHIVARLGGDEFGILLVDISIEEAEELFKSLVAAVSKQHFEHEGRVMEIGASIGVVLIENDRKSRELLLSQADVACYAAKDLGRNQVYRFSESDEQARRRQMEMRTATDFQQALLEGRLHVYAQPIVDLRDSTHPPVRNETLVRMIDRDGTLVMPGVFIPVVERHQLAHSLDRYMIEASLAAYARSPTDVTRSCTVGLSINLSGDTLTSVDFDSFVLDALNRHKVAPENVCFEITETAAIRNLDIATRFIASTRALGCSFSLDDFGAGLSSFGYLKDLVVDQIKIDGRFIKNICNDSFDLEIVKAITRVGSALKVKIVAEHVEDLNTAHRLTELGVDYGQGYFWGKPKPFEALLDDQFDNTTRSGSVSR